MFCYRYCRVVPQLCAVGSFYNAAAAFGMLAHSHFFFSLVLELTFVLHSHSQSHIFVTMMRVMCDMCNNVCINKIPNSFAIKSRNEHTRRKIHAFIPLTTWISNIKPFRLYFSYEQWALSTLVHTHACIHKIHRNCDIGANLHINWSKNWDKTPKTRQNHYRLLRCFSDFAKCSFRSFVSFRSVGTHFCSLLV